MILLISICFLLENSVMLLETWPRQHNELAIFNNLIQRRKNQVFFFQSFPPAVRGSSTMCIWNRSFAGNLKYLQLLLKLHILAVTVLDYVAPCFAKEKRVSVLSHYLFIFSVVNICSVHPKWYSSTQGVRRHIWEIWQAKLTCSIFTMDSYGTLLKNKFSTLEEKQIKVFQLV